MDAQASTPISARQPCVHILFVMLKVLKTPINSDLWLKPSLSTREVAAVLAYSENQHVAPRPSPSPETAPSPTLAAGLLAPKPVEEGDTCPICFDELSSMAPNELTWCAKSCGKQICLDCMGSYLSHSKSTSKPQICPLCRGTWLLEDLQSVAEVLKPSTEQEKSIAKKRPTKAKQSRPVHCSECSRLVMLKEYRCLHCRRYSLCERCFRSGLPAHLREPDHQHHKFVWRPNLEIEEWNAPQQIQRQSNRRLWQELQTRELGPGDYELLQQLDAQPRVIPMWEHLTGALNNPRAFVFGFLQFLSESREQLERIGVRQNMHVQNMNNKKPAVDVPSDYTPRTPVSELRPFLRRATNWINLTTQQLKECVPSSLRNISPWQPFSREAGMQQQVLPVVNRIRIPPLLWTPAAHPLFLRSDRRTINQTLTLLVSSGRTRQRKLGLFEMLIEGSQMRRYMINTRAGARVGSQVPLDDFSTFALPSLQEITQPVSASAQQRNTRGADVDSAACVLVKILQFTFDVYSCPLCLQSLARGLPRGSDSGLAATDTSVPDQADRFRTLSCCGRVVHTACFLGEMMRVRDFTVSNPPMCNNCGRSYFSGMPSKRPKRKRSGSRSRREGNAVSSIVQNGNIELSGLASLVVGNSVQTPAMQRRAAVHEPAAPGALARPRFTNQIAQSGAATDISIGRVVSQADSNEAAPRLSARQRNAERTARRQARAEALKKRFDEVAMAADQQAEEEERRERASGAEAFPVMREVYALWCAAARSRSKVAATHMTKAIFDKFCRGTRSVWAPESPASLTASPEVGGSSLPTIVVASKAEVDNIFVFVTKRNAAARWLNFDAFREVCIEICARCGVLTHSISGGAASFDGLDWITFTQRLLNVSKKHFEKLKSAAAEKVKRREHEQAEAERKATARQEQRRQRQRELRQKQLADIKGHTSAQDNSPSRNHRSKESQQSSNGSRGKPQSQPDSSFSSDFEVRSNHIGVVRQSGSTPGELSRRNGTSTPPGSDAHHPRHHVAPVTQDGVGGFGRGIDLFVDAMATTPSSANPAAHIHSTEHQSSFAVTRRQKLRDQQRKIKERGVTAAVVRARRRHHNAQIPHEFLLTASSLVAEPHANTPDVTGAPQGGAATPQPLSPVNTVGIEHSSSAGQLCVAELEAANPEPGSLNAVRVPGNHRDQEHGDGSLACTAVTGVATHPGSRHDLLMGAPAHLYEETIMSDSRNTSDAAVVHNVTDDTVIHEGSGASILHNDNDATVVQDASDNTAVHDNSRVTAVDHARETTVVHDANKATVVHDASDSTVVQDASDNTAVHDNSSVTAADHANETTVVHDANEATVVHNASDATVVHDASDATVVHDVSDATKIRGGTGSTEHISPSIEDLTVFHHPRQTHVVANNDTQQGVAVEDATVLQPRRKIASRGARSAERETTRSPVVDEQNVLFTLRRLLCTEPFQTTVSPVNGAQVNTDVTAPLMKQLLRSFQATRVGANVRAANSERFRLTKRDFSLLWDRSGLLQAGDVPDSVGVQLKPSDVNMMYTNYTSNFKRLASDLAARRRLQRSGVLMSKPARSVDGQQPMLTDDRTIALQPQELALLQTCAYACSKWQLSPSLMRDALSQTLSSQLEQQTLNDVFSGHRDKESQPYSKDMSSRRVKRSADKLEQRALLRMQLTGELPLAASTSGTAVNESDHAMGWTDEESDSGEDSEKMSSNRGGSPQQHTSQNLVAALRRQFIEMAVPLSEFDKTAPAAASGCTGCHACPARTFKRFLRSSRLMRQRGDSLEPTSLLTFADVDLLTNFALKQQQHERALDSDRASCHDHPVTSIPDNSSLEDNTAGGRLKRVNRKKNKQDYLLWSGFLSALVQTCLKTALSASEVLSRFLTKPQKHKQRKPSNLLPNSQRSSSRVASAPAVQRNVQHPTDISHQLSLRANGVHVQRTSTAGAAGANTLTPLHDGSTLRPLPLASALPRMPQQAATAPLQVDTARPQRGHTTTRLSPVVRRALAVSARQTQLRSSRHSIANSSAGREQRAPANATGATTRSASPATLTGIGMAHDVELSRRTNVRRKSKRGSKRLGRKSNASHTIADLDSLIQGRHLGGHSASMDATQLSSSSHATTSATRTRPSQRGSRSSGSPNPGISLQARSIGSVLRAARAQMGDR